MKAFLLVLDKLCGKFIGDYMTTLEYLTNGLDLSTAQYEAIMKLADVCGMKSLLEMARPRAASKGNREFLQQQNQPAPVKNPTVPSVDDDDDENYQPVLQYPDEDTESDAILPTDELIGSHSHSVWGNDLQLRKRGDATTSNSFKANVAAAGYDPNDFSATSTDNDAGSLWNGDSSVTDQFSVVDSNENKTGLNHNTYRSVGGLGDAWMFGDEGDEGMENVQTNITVDEMNNAKKDDYLPITNDADISLFVSRLCKLAKEEKDAAVNLANKCADIADRANSEFAPDGTTNFGMSSFDDTAELNAVNKRLTRLINAVYASPNYDNRLQMTKYIDEYVNNNPNSPFAQTLKDVKRDPKVKVKLARPSSARGNAAADKLSAQKANLDALNTVLGNFRDASSHTPKNELTGRSGLDLKAAKDAALNKFIARQTASWAAQGWEKVPTAQEMRDRDTEAAAAILKQRGVLESTSEFDEANLDYSMGNSDVDGMMSSDPYGDDVTGQIELAVRIVKNLGELSHADPFMIKRMMSNTAEAIQNNIDVSNEVDSAPELSDDGETFDSVGGDAGEFGRAAAEMVSDLCNNINMQGALSAADRVKFNKTKKLIDQYVQAYPTDEFADAFNELFDSESRIALAQDR